MYQLKWAKYVIEQRNKMVLEENVLDVDTYLMLRGKVKWKPLTKEQAEKALENSLYTVVAYENGKPVGMGNGGWEM